MKRRKNIYNHLTAKERKKLSFPVRWLYQNGYLKGAILDYGCGFGNDADILMKNGVPKIDKYDKYYFPDLPEKKYDTIICSYVLNVLERPEQTQVLMEISELLKQNGKAYFAVRRDVKYEGYRMHKIHKEYTYQCNVVLPYKSVFKNDFVEIYEYQRITDIPKTSECSFCNPGTRLEFITESAMVYSILDSFPVTKGHALVIPKKHIPNYFDLSVNRQQSIWIVVNRVKEILEERYKPEGFNIGFNVNEPAGQSIFHTHIHLIPRYRGDMDNPKGGVRHVIPEKGKY
ncbi:MAG: HIT domain-containing protein [Bacteroidales bacterium]|nr:HIT domain-containing protein [Bacteroidales bacterium]MCF8338740.1 HIT domain-containing protein [Bacteroidales bacterium]